MRHGLVGSHVFHDAAGGAHNLDSLARVIVGNVERCLLDGLKLVAVLVGLVHDLRTTNLELEALAAHRFHKNRQVQNATTSDANAALVFRLVNAHGNVGFLFAHEALFKLAGANDVTLTTHDGARGSFEHNGHGRLFDSDGLHFDRVLAIGNHISDVGSLNADNSNDVARMSLGDLNLAKVLKGVHLANLGIVRLALGGNHEHKVFLVNGAAMQATNADAAFVAAVVDGAHLHRNRAIGVNVGRRNFFQNGIEQRNHVHVAVVVFVASVAIHGRSVNNREIELLVGSAKFDHEVEHLIDGGFGVGIRAVDFVHNHHNAQAGFECMRKHETRLGLGAFVCVNDEQSTVGHVQHALDLAAEVGVARSVDDVDLHAFVVDGNILRQNGDATLTFLVIRVEHALLDLLILAEHVGCAQKAVDHRGFTMVDVRDDCHVAKVFLLHLVFFPVLFQLALLHLNFAEVLIERRDILARSRERDDTPNYQRSREASRPYDAAQEQRDNDAGRNHDDGIAALVAQSIVLGDELRARGFQTRDFRLACRVGLARARRRAALFRRRAIAREILVGVL